MDQRPDRTRPLIGPTNFIPIAEWSGLIVPLGEKVLRLACEQLVAWQRLHLHDDLFIAVNLSAIQMAHPNLLAEVNWIIGQTGADPWHIMLELKESPVMRDPESAVRVIDKLRQMRFRISIDDFGTVIRRWRICTACRSTS